jgi:hypothetical protein
VHNEIADVRADPLPLVISQGDTGDPAFCANHFVSRQVRQRRIGEPSQRAPHTESPRKSGRPRQMLGRRNSPLWRERGSSPRRFTPATTRHPFLCFSAHFFAH